SSNNEDYRYETLRDPYKAHNHFYDTVEEVNLVRGVTDDVYGSFGEMLTVYGGCKINIRAITSDNWPLTSALIRAAATPGQEQLLLDDVAVSALAQQLAFVITMPGTLNTTQSIAQFFKMCGSLPPIPQIPGQPPPPPMQLPFDSKMLPCITIDQKAL